jgi:outer membrane biosynthesis protein TonB
MDRAEQAGLGVAVAGHLLLFGALSLGLLAAPELPKIVNDPVEVALVDEVALQSAAPSPAPAAQAEPEPAPAPAPIAAPEPEPIPEPIAPPPPAPKAITKPAPKPLAKVVPKPIAKPAAKPQPKATPKPVKTAALDTRPRRRPGLSRSLVDGLSDTPSPAKAPAKPAAKPAAVAGKSSASPGVSLAQMSGAQKSSLNAMIYTQLKPHWKPPSGSDAELLVTRLSVRLNKDGSLDGAPEILGQDGVNDSNQGQAKLHAERAIQAVRRAAPFKLPPDYYDAWKWLKPLKLYVGQPG